jgi:hypothetical protein
LQIIKRQSDKNIYKLTNEERKKIEGIENEMKDV